MIIIFSCIDKMGNYEPTTFFILENGELGTYWVGKMKMELDAMDFPTRRSVSQSELLTKLEKKFETHHKYTRPSLDIRFLNNDGIVCYGVERWLSQLDNKIRKNPQMYEELRKLLTAGWTNDDFTMPSTLHVLHIWNPNKLTNINDLYSDLKRNWGTGGEGQLRSFHKLNKCLNERISKPKDVYLYQKGRAKLLREMKKTGKRPKPSTIEKYKITPEEILDIKKMSEEQLVMDERIGIIYKISSPSGKVYVGQTMRSFEERMYKHNHKSSRCTLIKKAIDKYGNEMKYEIIEDNVPQEQLDEREIYWINELHSLAPNGYNCTTGGRFFQVTQEIKDKCENAKRNSKIKRDGYLGDIEISGGLFRPRVQRNGKRIFLSKGKFQREEEAIEVLQEYTKDPDSFKISNNGIPLKVGTVIKIKNRWRAAYKGKQLGYYLTEKEGREAIERYQRDPENFTRPNKKYGSVRFVGNRWQFSYKHKYIGSYATQEEAEEARQTLQSSL
jgi:group I intron endonuclease